MRYCLGMQRLLLCVCAAVAASAPAPFAPLPLGPNGQPLFAGATFSPVGELIDVNGDHLPDLVYSFVGSDGGQYSTLFLNNGTGWIAQDQYTGLDPAYYRTYTVRTGEAKTTMRLLPTDGHAAFDTALATLRAAFGIPEGVMFHLEDAEGAVVTSHTSTPSGELWLSVNDPRAAAAAGGSSSPLSRVFEISHPREACAWGRRAAQPWLWC